MFLFNPVHTQKISFQHIINITLLIRYLTFFFLWVVCLCNLICILIYSTSQSGMATYS